MSDSFSETSTQGFFSRLTGSLAGLVIGPLLIIAAIVLLSWNEGRAVTAAKGLAEAAGKVVEAPAGAVVPANEGKLIHVIGAAAAHGPIADSDVGVSFADEAAVRRSVEMYQWVEHSSSSSHTNLGGSKTTTTSYTYTREWSSQPVDSSRFKHPQDHANRSMPFGARRFAAQDARLGAYSLDATTLDLIDPPQTLTPAAPNGWSLSDGHLYKGNAGAPAIGDLRVDYRGLPSGATLSVLAAQSRGGFAPFVASNGYQVQLAETGNRPAAVMLADKRNAESHLTWILRGAGALGIFIGFCMFLSPLSTLASVVPWLGRIIGGATAMLALVITVPLTLVVIALAWLAVRPLLGAALLVLATVALIGLARWHHVRKRARVQAAPSSA